MTYPLISVIVPIYNVEQYLRKCLDSLTQQSYRNLEILCINDGSTDSSAAILDEFARNDSRIKVFTQANAGLAAARNTGLKHATGEWITGVDSDDWLALDAIEKIHSVITYDVDIIWFGLQNITDTGEVFNEYYETKTPGKQVVTAELICNLNVNFCAKLWRTKFIRDLGVSFIPGLWYEDNYFFYATAPFTKYIYFLSDKLYFRYVRDESIMGQSQKKAEKCIDQIHIREHIFNYYQNHPLPAGFDQDYETPFQVYLFKIGYNFCMEHVPEASIPRLQEESRRIISHFNLDKYKLELGYITKLNALEKLFIEYKPRKIIRRFLGIPIIVTRVKKEYKVTSFLGIPIHRSRYRSLF